MFKFNWKKLFSCFQYTEKYEFIPYDYDSDLSFSDDYDDFTLSLKDKLY